MKITRKFTAGYLAVLSLAFVATASVFAQTAADQQSASEKKLNHQQLHRLIATAKTTADHQRIAQYYEAQAQFYLVQAKADAVKINAYKRSPYIQDCTMCVSSNYSLEAAIRYLRMGEENAEQRAAKMRQLAQQQELMISSNTPLAIRKGL